MTSAAARSVDPQYKEMLDQYASAMKLFGQQKFDRAKPLLEKVVTGPYRELADRAGLHLNVCNARLGGDGAPRNAEDLYQLAIIKLNTAQYHDAEELLTRAQKSGKMPHVSYALACLRAQTKELEAALTHLTEAIQGDRQFRNLARQDRDFAPLMDDPRFTEILYPEMRD